MIPMKALLCLLVLVSPLQAGRNFVRASNQYIEYGAQMVSAYPATLSGWFKTDDLSVNQVVVANSTSTTGIGVYLIVRGLTAGDPLSATDYDGSTSAQANSAATLTTGAWHHGGAVFNGVSSRDVYLNGTKTSNTTTVTSTIGSTNRTYVACLIPGNSNFSGLIAEAAIWNVALSADEMSALAKGCSPLRIRPASLVYYLPLWPTIFEYRGIAVTTGGSPTVSTDHPPIYY